MAMNVGAAAEDEVMMDINTTPLIDVMLVLLIMFIITIPIQTHAVKMNMPVPNNASDPAQATGDHPHRCGLRRHHRLERRSHRSR
jgi:biopolymer transport protein ExbD